MSPGGIPFVAALSAVAPQPQLVSSLSALGLGLVLGMRHALDADHLAAVSVIATEQRSLRGSSLVGAVWGIGHTLALLGVGVLVVLLRVEISDRIGLALELGVACMLIGLGGNALRTLHPAHADAPPVSDTRHPPHVDIGVRPLLVGMMHGLAGSAALMLLVLSSIASPLLGLAYLAVFGLGSVGGMVVVSALMSLPLHFARERFARAAIAVRVVSGVASVAIGLTMAYEIGAAGGIFV